MNRASEKLKSKRGATMIYALVFFMLCLFFGEAVLVSSTINLKNAQAGQNEGEYYLLSSAAEYIKEDINSMTGTYTAIENKTIYDCSANGCSIHTSPEVIDTFDDSSSGLSGCSIISLIHEGASAIIPYYSRYTVYSGEESSWTDSFTMSFYYEGTSQLEDVNAVITMDKRFNITILLTSGTSTIQVDIPAAMNSTEKVDSSESCTVNEEIYPINKYTNTVNVFWSGADISKRGKS